MNCRAYPLHSKEELVPGRSEDEDFFNKYGKSKNEEEEEGAEPEEETKPLAKEDLPAELQKFIDKRGAQPSKPPADPAKAIEGTLKRLKAQVIGKNAGSIEHRPPPRAAVPRGISSRPVSLHEALQHLSVTADPSALHVPPQRKVASIIELGTERFSKI